MNGHGMINCKTLVNGEKIIISNVITGNYLKTSKKYYDTVLELINDKNCNQLNDYSEKIQSNLRALIGSLMKIGVLEEKSKEYRFVEKNQKIESVFIICTNRCNLNCTHCSKESDFGNQDGLNSEKLKFVFDEVVDLKPISITLSGGEPLYRKNFIDELKYLRSIYEGKIVLSTNALLINEENIKDIINNIDTISISLDGVDEETCSEIRGKNYYANVMSKIELIKKHGFSKIVLSMTITKTTEKYKGEFIGLCKRLECMPLLRRFTPMGRGEINQNRLMSRPSEQAIELEGNRLRAKECSPILKEICIDEMGRVFPCQLLMERKFCLGNLLDIGQSLKVMIKKNGRHVNKEIENVRPFNSNECRECNVNLFCWSCLGNYINIKNNKEVFEELCEFKRNILVSKVWN
ncbi:radical SAM protein [Clostridium gasigenes]|uniref:Radical SAM protein n=1 Tax=Clostridium gasigenes TaxID=94869 RepID=A0A7X0SCM0_9CLOT|nr:radical SAM protein [Clostridium gasigenes]MBB6713126.1 radical SAM protein [Clostridium gasigenes]